MFTVQLLSNGRDIEKSYSKARANAEKQIVLAIRQQGISVIARVQRHASGRPGPEVVTGDYRRAWGTGDASNLLVGGGLIRYYITNYSPQTFRLEYGFHGVDSLGRHYDQPAYPHIAPAMQRYDVVFRKEMTQVLDKLLTNSTYVSGKVVRL